jgi:hypothetical protein
MHGLGRAPLRFRVSEAWSGKGVAGWREGDTYDAYDPGGTKHSTLQLLTQLSELHTIAFTMPKPVKVRRLRKDATQNLLGLKFEVASEQAHRVVLEDVFVFPRQPTG